MHVTDRAVPLRVTLHYTSGELVQPANIEKPALLQLDNDAPMLRAGENTTILRVRIMQISRNHMNKCFIVRISPDTSVSPLNNDVGYAECGPFEVRTKLVENDESLKRKRTAVSVKAEKAEHDATVHVKVQASSEDSCKCYDL